MSTSKRMALPTIPLGENRKLEKEAISSLTTTIGDLPPEVLTKILEFVALDGNRRNMLGYRLVSSQWKDVMDSLIEKKIVSGEFPASSKMQIVGVGRDERLHVRFSTRFSAGDKLLPFNSLVLSGSGYRYNPKQRHTQMSLLAFASRFGGALTSLGLQDQIFPLQTFATLLGSMSSLKRISLMDVKQQDDIIRAGAVFPTPPPLPSLATVEIKSSWRERDNINILFIWLIASYADQLVSLGLETVDPFPPLRTGHQYWTQTIGVNEEVVMVSTSEFAFGKLKELKIYRPTRQFLQLSEIPRLQRLIIDELCRETVVDLRSVVHFIGNCRGTLEELWLKVCWDQLLTWEVNMDDLARGQVFSPGSARVMVPKLKMLEMYYPYLELHELVLSKELILMFPALEKLHLHHFQPNSFDKWMDMDNIVSRDVPGNEAPELRNENLPGVVGLKRRLLSLREEVHERFLRMLGQLDRDDFIQIPAAENELVQGIKELREERASIFNRLEALGEKREKVLVEQLMERREFWSLLANLQIVSVSSGGKPDGDVCKIWGPVDA